jgi:ABC-type transport system involved in multi-copper enzyme maturation permease subunit
VNGVIRLARAELRKLFTTRALPVSFAIAIVLAIGSVIIEAVVAGKNGSPRLGTDAGVYQMLKLGAIPCVVMLILGILAAGGEFRHRTIVPVLLATPHRARVFAVKVAVIAGLGAVFSAVTFGLGLGAVVATLSAHGIGHLPPVVARLYLGTVVSSACFGMIGVALGALTRNTIGAIVAAIAWTLFVEQVILAAIVPGIEKWLPTGAAIGLTDAPGPGPLGPAPSQPAAVGGVVLAATVLAGYGIVMLLAASRTTIRRDVG